MLRREPSLDFRSAAEAALDGISDRDVLALAAAEGRIIVSHDENSMPAPFVEFLEAGNHSPRLLLVPQSSRVGPVIESIVLIWLATDPSEWIDRLAWLPI